MKSTLGWIRRQLASTPDAKALLPMVLVGIGLLALLGGSAAIAVELGLGSGAVLAALSTLFVLLAAFGGPLPADLRLLAWFGPLFTVLVGGVHALATLSPWLGLPAVVLTVFGCGLLPAIGARYASVGTALGSAVTLAFPLQLATVDTGPLVGSIAVGVVVAVGVRTLAGLPDPGKPTRKALAAALTGAAPDALTTAVRLWRSQPYAWAGRALTGIGGYRLATQILAARHPRLNPVHSRDLTHLREDAEAEAAQLAGQLQQKRPAADPPPPRLDLDTAPVPNELRPTLRLLYRSLDQVRTANQHRDTSRSAEVPYSQLLLANTTQALLSWQSLYFRHALRCALSILIVSLVAIGTWGFPLNTTLLSTTFSVLSPAFVDTASKAVQRLAGAAVGVLGAVGLVAVLPSPVLLAVALVTAVLSVGFIARNRAVFAGLVAMLTVLAMASTRDLSAAQLSGSYLLIVLLAVAATLIPGFVAVPRLRPPTAPELAREAMSAAKSLLRGTVIPPRTSEQEHDLLRRYLSATRQVHNLQTLTNQHSDLDPAYRDLADALDALRTEVAACVTHPDPAAGIQQALTAAREILDRPAASALGVMPEQPASLLAEALLSHALAARTALDHLDDSGVTGG